MEPADPIKTGVVLAAALQAAKQAQDFIATISGHPGESLGTILGNIGKQRLENLEAVGNRAHLTALNIGVKVGQIPLNVRYPIFEGASLQEEPTIQDTWANMMTNASDSRQTSPVQAAFPAILKDLGPREVKFLDAVYLNNLNQTSETGLWHRTEGVSYSIENLKDIYWEAALSSRRLAFVTHGDRQSDPDTLEREEAEFRMTFDIIQRHNLIQVIPGLRTESDPPYRKPTMTQIFRLTAFGSAFIRACRPPNPVVVDEAV